MNTNNTQNQHANANELVLKRVINAPRTIVFEAFTQPEHLAHWWGPAGFTLNISRFNLEPGGIFLYSMTDAHGGEMWGKFEYRDIKAPESITFINSFSDAEGRTVRAPFADKWPLEMLNHWVFEEQDGKTLLTLHACAHNANAEETQTFVAGFDSMDQGFGGTFDQLDAYLLTLGY